MLSQGRCLAFSVVLLCLVAAHLPGAEQTAQTFYQLGLEAKQAGKLQQAVGELQKALQLDAEHVDAHWALAWVYVAQGKNELAGRHFRQVLRLAPDSHKAAEAAKALERMGLAVEVSETTPEPTADDETVETGASATAEKAEQDISTDISLWDELDIVPMPKQIQLTGRELPMDAAVLVIGETPSKQDQIGADWINDRIEQLGGKRIPVTNAGDDTTDQLRIVIGTRGSNKLVDNAVRDGYLKVGPNEPGERGYVIVSRADAGRTELFVGGADAIGALYGCVTLAELMYSQQGTTKLREATVRDWPDFKYTTLGGSFTGSTRMPELALKLMLVRVTDQPSEQVRRDYLEAIRRHYDRLLRWKISSLWYRDVYFTHARFKDLSPATREIVREGIEYGKERGIGALLAFMHPFAGLVEDHPEYEGPRLPAGRYPKWIRCWSLDEMRAESARQLALFCADVGFTDVAFHDTDAGGFANPAQWNDRCELCRQRWGDDYAAATANKHRIYYEALQKHAPGTKMHAVLYPYHTMLLTQKSAEQYVREKYGGAGDISEAARAAREKWENFWRTMGQSLPGDVTFCVRENSPKNHEAFRGLIGDHGVFVYFKTLWDPWSSLFSETPRWVGSFYQHPEDFLFAPTLQTFVPMEALAVQEYAWNGTAPGAAPWNRLAVQEQWKHCEPHGEIYETVLPHVVRNLFGRRVGAEICEALRKNISPFEIFGHKLFGGRPMFLESYERMKWQADLAQEGMDALDSVWAKRQGDDDQLGMTDYAFRRLVYLREIFHTCRWMAKARAHNLLGLDLAKAGDSDGARAQIEAGRKAIQQGEQDAERLLAERPSDPIYAAHKDGSGYRMFRIFAPGEHLDFSLALEELNNTEAQVPVLLAGVSKTILEDLQQRKLVHAGLLQGHISADGRMDEEAWSRGYPVESLLVTGEIVKVASASTAVRLLYDDSSLYVGASCWLPEGDTGPVVDDDTLVVSLAAPQMDGHMAQISISAGGAASGRSLIVEGKSLQDEGNWPMDGVQARVSKTDRRWDMEAQIPLGRLGPVGKGWRFNAMREYKSSQGSAAEISTAMRSDTKNTPDFSRFPAIAFTPEDFVTPPPHAEIELTELTIACETLNDRITTACRFGIQVDCSRVLHEATISAKLYDNTGTVHATEELETRRAILYTWAPEKLYELYFPEVSDSGALALRLESEEVSFERCYRFGGCEIDAGDARLLDPAVGHNGSGALTGQCFFSPRVTDSQVPVFASRQGTIEFWLKPQWPSHRGPFYKQFDMWIPRHTLIHYSPLRMDYPSSANHPSLLIDHLGESVIRLYISTRENAIWQVLANADDFGGWEANSWHHVAAVWDASAKKDRWLRIYLDGRSAGGKLKTVHADRLGDDKAVRIPTLEPYSVQIGALVSSWMPGRAVIDELRVSRAARYDEDFDPPSRPFAPDKNTGALFHFDGDLAGVSCSPDGTQHTLTAAPGSVLSQMHSDDGAR